jgi:hypothetical protein
MPDSFVEEDSFVEDSFEEDVEPQQESFLQQLSNAQRQLSVGFAGGQTGGLTDVLANRLGIPQSPLRDVAGAAGMLIPTPVSVPFKAARVAGALTKSIPRAGVLGRMAVRGAEGALGAGATQLGTAIEERDVSPILKAAGLGAAGGAAIPPVGAALKATGKGLKRVSQLATGNRAEIARARQEVSRMKDLVKSATDDASEAIAQTIRSFRLGGGKHEEAIRAVQKSGRSAWAPVEQLSRDLKIPIKASQLEEEALAMFGHDQSRLNAVQGLIKDGLGARKPAEKVVKLFDEFGREIKTSEGFRSDQLVDQLTQFGRSIRSSTKETGTTARNLSDQLLTDARNLIANVLEKNAPIGSKGLLDEGLKNWKIHATIRRQLFRTVRPGLVQEAEIGPGLGIVERGVGIGGPKRSRVLDPETILDNLRKQFGVDLRSPIQPQLSSLKGAESMVPQAERALERAELLGRRGLAGTGVATATGLAGGGLVALLRALGLQSE